jgi:hypothetical protein
MFDPDEFLNQSVEGSLDTRTIPVPEGEFPAVVSSLSSRVVGPESKPVLDLTWKIQDSEEVARATGRDVNTVRQTIWLDISEAGGLDMSKGKNVQLGRVRDAVGQNGPGPWSAVQLEGAMAVVRVEQRIYEGETYSDVKGVRAA